MHEVDGFPLQPFTADDLIECYKRGVFPMADARRDRRLYLVDPARRGLVPLEGFRVSRRLARTVRSDRFAIRRDTSFEAVIEACAAPSSGRMETWINRQIQGLCVELFARGVAHSLEAWREGRLVGGLYGVAVGAAFFGESMFQIERDASKVALTHLAARLRFGGYRLLDAQFVTDHLRQFGTTEVSRREYRTRLTAALETRADFARFDPYAGGAAALQAISQAS